MQSDLLLHSMEKETVKRLAPTKDTLNLLFGLCGNHCAFPGCSHPVFDAENNFIAQVCHIESANEGGERFNPDSNNEERRQFANLIVMCYEHHKVTDNVEIYPGEKMRELKTAHETKFRSAPSFVSPDQIDEIFQLELQKTVQKIEVATRDIIDTQTVHTDILNKILDSVNRDVSRNKKTDFDKQIDTIISLRSTNQHKAAIKFFEKLKEDEWENLSARERYRLQANLGILNLDLIENDIAAAYFIDSYSYQPEEPRAIGWAILGYSLLGDEDRAEELIKKGLAIDPLNVGIYSSMVRLKRNLPLANVIEMVPGEIRQQSEIAYEISRVAQSKKDYNAAITWAQVALDGAGENKFELRAVLATTILESVLSPFLVISSQVSQDTKNKARYIIELYSQAWDEVKHSDLHESRTWFLINRAVAKMYLGDMEGCYLDSKQAYDHKKDSFSMRHLAIAAMRTKREKESLELIAELKPLVFGADLHELIHFEAQVHLQMQDTETGLAILDTLLEQDISKSLRLFIIDFLCQRQIDKGNLPEAISLNDQATSIDPNAATALLLKGKIAHKLGHKDDAVEIFTRLFSKIDYQTPEIDVYDLSLQFEILGMPKEAIALMEKVSDLATYSGNTKRLLELYFRFGENARLLSICKNLTERFGPIPTVTELRSHVLEDINDFPSAIAICLEHLEIYPNDQFILVRLALIYARIEDWKQVGAIVDTINHMDKTLKMDIQFKIAMLCHGCGRMEKFHHFALQTRRQFKNEVSAHENFIHLGTVIASDEERPIDPEIVGVDCQVTLTSGDISLSYQIENRDDLRRIDGDILPDSPEAIAVLGKKLGEEVILGPHQQRFVVSTITHIFNAAMRESYHLISTTFASQTNFRQFSIGKTGNFEEDFKALFDVLDNKSSWEKDIAQMYLSRKLPLSTIAQIKKTNLIRVWGGFVSDEKHGLLTTFDRPEIYRAFAAFDEQIPILIDVTGLCTIAQLGCYEEILHLGCKLFVSESSILEVHDLVRELKGSSQKGSLTVGKQDGRYVRQFINPEQINAQIEHLSTLLDWIKKNCTSLPCTAALKMNGAEKKKLDDAIGESTIDSILTAQEQHYVLHAEEALIRMLAYEQNGVPGTATFMVLLYLMIKNKIPRQRYLDLTIDLMGMNYKHIPVDSHVILAAAKKTKYIYSYPLPNVTQGLLTNMVDHEYIIKVVCDYFAGLYKEPVDFVFETDIQVLRKNIIVHTLEVLAVKFEMATLEIPLISGLEIRMGGIDHDCIQLVKIISSFCRNRS